MVWMMYNNIDENINFVRKEVDVDAIGYLKIFSN